MTDRELDDVEYLNWCASQPYNMVVAVELRGELTEQELRVALAKAQLRHPLLRVNTEVRGGRPWFTSEGVGEVPLTVVPDAAPDAARAFADQELGSTFLRDEEAPLRPPLMRVSLFLPKDATEPKALVFTVQHVIADGLSMVFLVRDLLGFLEAPESPVLTLDAPSHEGLLPPAVQRWIPRTALRASVALGAAKLYARLKGAPSVARTGAGGAREHRAWALTVEETRGLRAACRRERASVQSAICTAFLPAFPAVHTPVSLRPFLARSVGESFGLFVGAAEVKMTYDASRPFWDNARAFHRRLRRGMRNPFQLFMVLSRAVPAEKVRELMDLGAKLTSGGRTFAVTNLGELDGSGLKLQGDKLKVESFSGAVTGIVEASVLTVYTIEGRLRLHLLATDASAAEDADRAVERLIGVTGAAATS